MSSDVSDGCTGIDTSLGAISSQLGENSFLLAMNVLKFETPFGLIALIIFLFYRIKSIRLRPNIS